MEIRIDRSELSECLATVSKAVAGKTSQDILTGVKVSVNQEGLQVTAYDLELGITTKTNMVEVLDPGEVVLPGKIIDLVKKFYAESLTIKSAGLNAEILQRKAKYQVNGMNPGDFPHLPELYGSSVIKISANALKHMILSTAFAASKLEARPILTGVHVTLDSGVLKFEATDGARMGLSQLLVPDYPDFVWDVVVPARILGVILKQLPDEGNVQLQIGSAHMLIGIGENFYYIRLLSGDFPYTDNIVPRTSGSAEAVVNGAELFKAVDRLLTPINAPSAPIQLEFQAGSLKIKSASDDFGLAEEIVECEFSGAPLEMGMNGRYLLDALRALENDTVRMEIHGSKSPCVIRSSHRDEDLQVISPFLLKNF